MLKKLTSIIEFQSEREKSWEQAVIRYGGPKRILNNPDDLQTVANIIEGRSLHNAASTGAKSASAGGPGAKPGNLVAKGKDGATGTKFEVGKDEPKFSRKELLEVQQPLSKLLDEGRVYYERKLDAQVQFLTNQIERSTQRILHRLDGGSWMKIQDPDLQTVWRDNVCTRTNFLEGRYSHQPVDVGVANLSEEPSVHHGVARLLPRPLRTYTFEVSSIRQSCQQSPTPCCQ